MPPFHNKQKRRRILFSPLNWGLGHAARLIPVIDRLIKDGHYCIVGGEEPSINIIKKALPGIDTIELPGFRPVFSSSNIQWGKFLLQIPEFIISVYRENNFTKKLIKEYNIDLIISDNRYGVRNKNTASVLD